MTDEHFRQGLRTRLHDLPDGRKDLDGVTKLSRKYRVRNYVYRVVAVTVAGAAVTAPLVMLVPLAFRELDHRSPTMGETQPSSQRPIAPSGFASPSYPEGDRTIVPVTFPDGTTAELVFDPEVDPAALGITGSHVRADWEGSPENAGGCGWEFVVSYGDPRGSLYQGEEPVSEYEGSSNRVELWRGVNNSRFALVYRADPWTVTLPCSEPIEGNTAAHEEWARSLILETTPVGFLLIESTPPLRLGLLAGYERPGLIFGTDEGFQLRPGPCNPPTAQGVEVVEGVRVARFPGGASWCIQQASMAVTAYGESALVDELVRGLDVRHTRLG